MGNVAIAVLKYNFLQKISPIFILARKLLNLREMNNAIQNGLDLDEKATETHSGSKNIK